MYVRFWKWRNIMWLNRYNYSKCLWHMLLKMINKRYSFQSDETEYDCCRILSACEFASQSNITMQVSYPLYLLMLFFVIIRSASLINLSFREIFIDVQIKGGYCLWPFQTKHSKFWVFIPCFSPSFTLPTV